MAKDLCLSLLDSDIEWVELSNRKVLHQFMQLEYLEEAGPDLLNLDLGDCLLLLAADHVHKCLIYLAAVEAQLTHNLPLDLPGGLQTFGFAQLVIARKSYDLIRSNHRTESE